MSTWSLIRRLKPRRDLQVCGGQGGEGGVGLIKPYVQKLLVLVFVESRDD